MALRNEEIKDLLKIVIAIDSGKFSTKWYDGKKKGNFRTTLKEIDAYDPTLRGAFIEYKDKKYQVAETNGKVDTEKSKKKIVHRLSILYALSEMKVAPLHAINLVVGCPSDICKNQDERNEYAEYIKGEGTIEIIINHKLHIFNIANVLVLPESSGVIFREENYEKYANRLVGVVDIGGLNLQGCMYMECSPIHDSIFALNKGTNNLYAEIKTMLNSKKNEDGSTNNYSDVQILYKLKYLNNKELNGLTDEEIKLIKEKMKNHLLDNAFSEMESLQWNVKGMNLIFTGGGSELMKSEIKELGYEVSEDAIYDNVIGFYEVGVDYYNGN